MSEAKRGGSVVVEGRTLALDEDGHLLQASDWSPAVAEALAAADGQTLDAAHWWLIRFAREYHARYDALPLMRAMARSFQEFSGEQGAASRGLYRLFPDGPVRLACKYGGLPKPQSCI